MRQAIVECAMNALAVADFELRPCRRLELMLRGDAAGDGSRAYCAQCRTFGRLEIDNTIDVSRRAFPPRRR